MEKEQLEKLTKDYQGIQMQVQSLALQKAQFSQQKEEYTEAQTELQVAAGKVYTEIGGLLVETTKDTALKNLKEKLESIDMRLTIVSKQYDEVMKKEQTMRNTLTSELQKAQKQ